MQSLVCLTCFLFFHYLLKLDYAKFGVSNLFLSKVIEEKLLGVSSNPPISLVKDKDWGCFPPDLRFLPVTLDLIKLHSRNLVAFPKI